MSRTGRAIDLLRDYKEHDVVNCSDFMCDHSHITDPWDVVNALLDIDPRFHDKEIERERRAAKAEALRWAADSFAASGWDFDANAEAHCNDLADEIERDA